LCRRMRQQLGAVWVCRYCDTPMNQHA
jgi:hypothetical protein